MSGAALPLVAFGPLLLSALCVVLRVHLVQRVLMIATPAVTGVIGLWLLAIHRHTPHLTTDVGGFVPGIAISFVSDSLSALMLAVTGLTTAVVTWFLALTGEDRNRFFPALALMLVAGVNGALLTADLFNLFVFIEVMLLPSYALIAVTGTRRRLGVGRLFVLVNLVTSTILLIGVGLVYAVAGTVSLPALAGVASDPRAAGAVTIVLLALAIKAGVAPVHWWLPRSYPGTSAGVMALFAGVHTKVALYAVLRVYTVTQDAAPARWWWVIALLVALTVLLGSIGTASSTRVRGAMAWQMVAGVGHILIGVALLGVAAVSASLLYLTHHVITMGGLLLAFGAVEHTYRSGRYATLGDLMRREKLLAVTCALGLASLVGLPPTSGLWGKLALVRATVAASGWPAWVIIGSVLLASVASLMALQTLWTESFWGQPHADKRRGRPGETAALPIASDTVPLAMALPAVLLIAASVAIFLAAGPVMAATDAAAHAVLDVTGYARAVLP